jgi:hypothetical protein
MLVVVAGIYMFAGGRATSGGSSADDIESPRKFPRRTAQD